MSIEALIAGRRLERVGADAPGALRRLEAAERHLVTAGSILDDDPDAAYAVLYDAARKAVTAHMLAAGLRVRNAPGAHAAVAEYASSELDAAEAVELDRMRRSRNKIEYGSTSFTSGQAAHDLENARLIVRAVREALDR